MTARVGDWYDLTEGAHAVVLAVDGARALCVDPYDNLCGGWLDLPEDLKPLSAEDVERRIEGLLAGAASFDTAAASYEASGRRARASAEQLRMVVEIVRRVTTLGGRTP